MPYEQFDRSRLRLKSLTDERVKPALPVGGTFRLIDIALSNLAHSHLADVGLIEQFLPHALNSYLAAGRPWDLDRNHGGLQVLPPFEGGPGEGFASGNADSIHRQRTFIRGFGADHVLILSADHLYTMNFLDVLETHVTAGADLTIVTTLINEDASRYGVVQADGEGNEYGFHGVIHDLVAPERIVQTFEFEGVPGHVSLETATFEFLITDFTPRWEFFLVQDPSAPFS